MSIATEQKLIDLDARIASLERQLAELIIQMRGLVDVLDPRSTHTLKLKRG